MQNIPLRLMLCAVLVVSTEVASASADDWVAQIKVSHGVVAIQRDNRSLPGEIGKRLKENDIIVTNADSSVGMTFNDNSMLSLGANSEVILRRYSYDPTTYIGAFDAVVKKGSVSVTTGNIVSQSADAMRLSTPDAELQAGKPGSYAISVEGR